MCYRKRLPEGSIGYMPFEMFKTIVDECVQHNLYSIRLSWRGEPLIHPDVVRMVRYAKEQGIKNVSFLTNGLLLKGKLAEDLIDANLTYLSISFDGVKEIYDKIRKPSTFQEAYQRIKDFQELKNKKQSRTPLVRVCTIWPAIAHNPEEYYEIMSNVTQKVVFNPYIDFWGNTQKPLENFVCQYPWQRLSITCKGKIFPCTGVSINEGYELGQVGQTAIYDAWHSDKLNYMRKKHIRLERMDIHVCAECRHGMEKELYSTEGFSLEGDKEWIE
jgi:radical SAM protein with 4Fe4S-binding SPASM domain